MGNGARLWKKISCRDFNFTALHHALTGSPDKEFVSKKAEKYKIKIEIVKLLLRHDYAITPDQKERTGYDNVKEKKLTEITEIIRSRSPFFRMKILNLDGYPKQTSIERNRS